MKILFLPVALPELNPIESVWGAVKRAIETNNCNFRLSEVEELTREELKKYDAGMFS